MLQGLADAWHTFTAVNNDDYAKQTKCGIFFVYIPFLRL